MPSNNPTPSFSDLTTLRVGGAIGHYHRLGSRKKAIEKTLAVWESGEEWMVLGGGSNLVVSDDGFPGHVLHVGWKGKKRTTQKDGSVLLTVQAGEDWDSLVDYCVREGLSGLESLSGIPGTVGASVIQNIGAYGHEISEVLDHIDFLDYTDRQEKTLQASELNLGHRTSALKAGDRQGLVLSVTFRLNASGQSLPVKYAQLASALEVEQGESVGLDTLRQTVLGIRAEKGMVLNPADQDSRSVGSFFVNPVVSERFAYSLPSDAPKWALGESSNIVIALDDESSDNQAGEYPQSQEHDGLQAQSDEGMVKLSAAWLIEHAGINKGFHLPGNAARVSTKHSLAITNPDAATAEDVASLARYIKTHVANTFGVVLQPEPTLVGIELE